VERLLVLDLLGRLAVFADDAAVGAELVECATAGVEDVEA
jgi:hypothetical protein